MVKIKIILLIRSLEIGGAERQFIELIKGIDKNKFEVLVCTMFEGDRDFEVKDVKDILFKCFKKKSRYDIISYFKYCSFILKNKPNLIYSFMSDSNLISFICAKLVFSKSKLIWGIRGSITDLKMYDSFSKYIFKVEKVLSSFIDLIIYNSYHSEKGHNLIGFSPKNSIVIQNGIDLNRFKSDKNKRLEFRTKYNLEQNDLAIGITSRIDPIKGYIDFCNAAVLILNKYTNIKIFSIGYGIESIIKECETILGHFNNTRFIWLGKQLYPENIMTGWDIYCSASLPGEGFPNAIAEAMACELAPVVTESGDSSIIVANIGLISKCSDSENLFENLEKMINSNELENLKISSRIRVLNNYSLIQMVEKTESQILRIVQIYKK